MKKILFSLLLLTVLVAGRGEEEATTDADASTEVTVNEDGSTTTTTTTTTTISTSSVEVSAESVLPEPEWVYYPLCDTEIVSVSYGVTDVTYLAQQKYANGQRTFGADDTEWGDGWPGYEKSLVVVYDLCDNYATAVAREGGYIQLP